MSLVPKNHELAGSLTVLLVWCLHLKYNLDTILQICDPINGTDVFAVFAHTCTHTQTIPIPILIFISVSTLK